jgi:hypothetical protein
MMRNPATVALAALLAITSTSACFAQALSVQDHPAHRSICAWRTH